ncbi:MAG: glycosyltransferase family 39 protein [bacterium]|nr:glycosyltransferase family 39 protein [bacterium]
MKSAWKWPVILGLAAVVVRLIYLIGLSSDAGFLVPQIDERWHWEWAQQIVQESFWGDGAYFRAPFYPYLLGLFYYITSGSIFWAKFLQLLLCFGTTIGIYSLAQHLFDRRTAIVSSLIYVFYGTLVFYEAMFLIPVLFLPLSVWGMLRLIRLKDSVRMTDWLITGLIFGLAALARPNILITLPFLALWLWKKQSGRGWKLPSIKSPIMLAVGVLIAIAPVTIRNMVVTGEFMLISSQGGINLYLGNNPKATGLSMQMPEVDLNEAVSWNHFMDATNAVAVRESGRALSDGEYSSFWTGKAVDWILSNPGPFIGLVWKKTVYLFNGFENSDNIEIYYHRSKSLLHSLLVWNYGLKFPFGLLLPLTLVGIWVTRKRFSELLPVYIFVLAYIPSIVLFLVTARHRLVLIPFMGILAAAGLLWLWDHRKQLLAKKSIIAPVILVVSALLVNTTYYGVGSTNVFQDHYNDGLRYLRLEDWTRAEKEFLKADAAYQYSGALLNNLGWVQYNLGKMREADQNYNRALQAEPDFWKTYNNLGLLVEKQGLLDSALYLYRRAIGLFDSTRAQMSELAQFYLNAADIYEMQKKDDTVALLFQSALKAAPEMKAAYFKAAVFYARRKEYEQSDSLFARGARLGEPSGNHFFNWGLTELERGRSEAGLILMQKALRRKSNMFEAAYCVAAAHHNLGSPADSIQKYLDSCLSVNPGFSPALRLQQQIQGESGR